MPHLTNGGGLLLILLIVAVLGLAMLVDHATRARCSDCGRPLGTRPRFWRLPGSLPPEPLCAACFTASGPVGE